MIHRARKSKCSSLAEEFLVVEVLLFPKTRYQIHNQIRAILRVPGNLLRQHDLIAKHESTIVTRALTNTGGYGSGHDNASRVHIQKGWRNLDMNKMTA